MIAAFNIHRALALVATSLGFAASALLLRMAWEDSLARLRDWRLYVELEVGVAIVVALITEAVFHAPGLPFSWRVWVYCVGLIAIVHPAWVLARHRRKRRAP